MINQYHPQMFAQQNLSALQQMQQSPIDPEEIKKMQAEAEALEAEQEKKNAERYLAVFNQLKDGGLGDYAYDIAGRIIFGYGWNGHGK